MKKCPRCSEAVYDKTTKCEHCGFELRRKGESTKVAIIIFLVLLAILVFLVVRAIQEMQSLHESKLEAEKKVDDFNMELQRSLKERGGNKN